MRLCLAHLRCDFAPVHAGHGIIEHHGFDRFARKDIQSGRTVGSRQNPIAGALQQYLADLEADQFVVDAEDEM